MRLEKLKTMLNSDDEATLVDLNDWAINTVRNYCRERGYNAVQLVREESARIDTEWLTLGSYGRCRRIGSRFLLTRRMRRAVYAIIATRKKLRS